MRPFIIIESLAAYIHSSFCEGEKNEITDICWNMMVKQEELTLLCGPDVVSKLERNDNVTRIQSNVEEAS